MVAALAFILKQVVKLLIYDLKFFKTFEVNFSAYICTWNSAEKSVMEIHKIYAGFIAVFNAENNNKIYCCKDTDMNTDSNIPNSTSVQMKIPTDIPLWSYLLSGHKNSTRKFSRAEAFFDLMQRQYAALHDGREKYLHGNVVKLAAAWHWNRDTASVFLDKLEQLDVLTSHTIGNRKAFMLKYNVSKENVPGASQSPSEPLTPSFLHNST